MDDTTLSEVIDVTNHVSGNCSGNSQSTVNNIIRFTKNEQMELNAKKCNEMIVDFRKSKTVIPPSLHVLVSNLWLELKLLSFWDSG